MLGGSGGMPGDLSSFSLCGKAAVFNLREPESPVRAASRLELPRVHANKRPSLTSYSHLCEKTAPARQAPLRDWNRSGRIADAVLTVDASPYHAARVGRAAKVVAAALANRVEAEVAEAAAAGGGAATGEVFTTRSVDVETQRLRAVQRLRERRERADREAESERERAGEARASAANAQARTAAAAEARDQFRAEVYAINRLMQQRDEAQYTEFAAARADQLEEIEARHAEEEEARRQSKREADEALRQRVKEKEAEASRAKAKAKAEAEEAAAKREEERREKRMREEEREVFRSQVRAAPPHPPRASPPP